MMIDLLRMAAQTGRMEQGATWEFISAWAAREILLAHKRNEDDLDEKATHQLRARISTLKDLLALGSPVQEQVEDQTPFEV
jgi:hypothetical protein